MVLTASLAVFVVLAKTRPGDYEASVTPTAIVALVVRGGWSALLFGRGPHDGLEKGGPSCGLAVGVLFGGRAMLTANS